MSEEETVPSKTVVEHITVFFDPYLESKKHANLLIIGFIALAAVPLVVVGLLTTRTILPPAIGDRLAAVFPSEHIRAHFVCDRDTYIDATFTNMHVQLSLSDGRHIELPQVLSASGARYANADESFTFWNTGTHAFVEEQGILTYTGCVTNN